MGNGNRKPRCSGHFNHFVRFLPPGSSRDDCQKILTTFLYENENLADKHLRKAPTSLGEISFKNDVPFKNKSVDFSNRTTEDNENEEPTQEETIRDYLYSFLPASWPKEWDILKDEERPCPCNCPCKFSTLYELPNLENLSNPDCVTSIYVKPKKKSLINRKSRRLHARRRNCLTLTSYKIPTSHRGRFS